MTGKAVCDIEVFQIIVVIMKLGGWAKQAFARYVGRSRLACFQAQIGNPECTALPSSSVATTVIPCAVTEDRDKTKMECVWKISMSCKYYVTLLTDRKDNLIFV